MLCTKVHSTIAGIHEKQPVGEKCGLSSFASSPKLKQYFSVVVPFRHRQKA